MEEITEIAKISGDTKDIIKRKSAYSLPDNPSELGYTPDEIKKTLYTPIIDVDDNGNDRTSIISEINRVVYEANTVDKQLSKTIEGNDKNIAINAENIASLSREKLDKISASEKDKVYTVLATGEQTSRELVSEPVAGQIPIYSENGCISVDTPDDSAAATPKKYVDDELKKMGCRIECDISETDYKMSVKLINGNNIEISKSEIDLPLETMVVSAQYDNDTKQIQLMLKNGETVAVNVSDLISGLVNQEDLEKNYVKKDTIATEKSLGLVKAREYVTGNPMGIFIADDGFLRIAPANQDEIQAWSLERKAVGLTNFPFAVKQALVRPNIMWDSYDKQMARETLGLDRETLKQELIAALSSAEEGEF